MAKAGSRLSEDHKQAIGDGVARGRRKPVGIASVSVDGGSTAGLAVLWSDGEVELRDRFGRKVPS